MCSFCILLASKNVRKVVTNIASFLGCFLGSILVPKYPKKVPHGSAFWSGGPPLRPLKQPTSQKRPSGDILAPFWLHLGLHFGSISVRKVTIGPPLCEKTSLDRCRFCETKGQRSLWNFYQTLTKPSLRNRGMSHNQAQKSCPHWRTRPGGMRGAVK